MDLAKALNRFYYDLSLSELRMMNDNTIYPNISYNSLLYLDLISYMDGCTASQLAERLHISKSAVTAKVNELVGQGLVQKTQSERDKRVFYLTLSKDVEEDFSQDDRLINASARRIEKNYTKEQVELFMGMLDEIRKEYTE